MATRSLSLRQSAPAALGWNSKAGDGACGEGRNCLITEVEPKQPDMLLLLGVNLDPEESFTLSTGHVSLPNIRTCENLKLKLVWTSLVPYLGADGCSCHTVTVTDARSFGGLR